MPKIICAEHGTDILLSSCEKCMEKNIEEFNKHYAGMNVTASLPCAATEILVDGKPAIVYHSYDYIEQEIPFAINDEIQQYIAKRISEYEALCECVACVRKRINKAEEIKTHDV